MGIGEDIKQKHFKSEYSKAVINIFYTSSWLNQKHYEFFKSFDLTVPQFNVLRILRGQFPSPATVNMIIDRMLDKSSNASRILDRLERKKLVERKQCSKDRRAVDVFITESGLELLAEMDQKLMVLETELNHVSEDESKLLNELLDKFRS